LPPGAGEPPHLVAERVERVTTHSCERRARDEARERGDQLLVGLASGSSSATSAGRP